MNSVNSFRNCIDQWMNQSPLTNVPNHRRMNPIRTSGNAYAVSTGTTTSLPMTPSTARIVEIHHVIFFGALSLILIPPLKLN